MLVLLGCILVLCSGVSGCSQQPYVICRGEAYCTSWSEWGSHDAGYLGPFTPDAPPYATPDVSAFRHAPAYSEIPFDYGAWNST